MQPQPETSSAPASPRRQGPRAVRSAALSLLVLLALPLGSLVLVPSPAVAHVALVSSSPDDGARLGAVPDEVALTFSEAVADPAYVVVTSTDGTSVTQGATVADGRAVTQRLEPGTAPGAYTIAYRVASPDGHPVTGELQFTVTAASTPPAEAASPATAPTPSPSMSPSTAPSTAPSPSTAPPAAEPGTGAVSTTGATRDASATGGGLQAWHLGLGAVLLVAATVLVLRRRRA